MLNNRFILILLVLVNILFLIYFTLLAVYGRLHYDDYHFLWKLRDMSIPEYINELYFRQTGRFVAVFTNGVVFKTILLTGFHQFIPVLFWISGVLLIWLTFSIIFKNQSRFLLLNLAALFYHIYVISNIDFPVFYWLCALSYYLLFPSLIALIAIINKPDLNWKHYLLIAILTVFIGGTQETFAPLAMFLLFVNGLIILKYHQFDFLVTFRDIKFKTIITLMIVIAVLLVVVVIAPGNYVRMGLEEFVRPSSIGEYTVAVSKAIATFSYFQLFYLPYYLILLAVMTALLKMPVHLPLKRFFPYAIIIFILYVLLTVLPFAYLWNDFGIQRNYTQLVMASMFMLVYAGFVYLKRFEKLMKILAVSGLIILTAIMLFNLFYDIPAAREYALSVDERAEKVLALKNSNQTGEYAVEPIKIPYTTDVKYHVSKYVLKKESPVPLLYYYSDTDSIPNEYAEHYSRVYDLDFLIKLDNNSDSK
jgi:hypothetical protein